jgi:exopolysaccharide production protein ExoQ
MEKDDVYPHSMFDFLRERMATAWVAFFFAVDNVNVFPKIVPLAAIGGFCICLFLYHKELYHFILRKPIVISYLTIVLLSASWSIVPSQSLWYGIQLCVTALSAILLGVAADTRQILRGTFIAMAVVIVASIVSGRHGASAAGPVLVGITGGKTVIGMVAVFLVGSALALVLDRTETWIYRVPAVVLLPVGFYLATHVEAATAKVAVMIFPVALAGFLFLRAFNVVGRWALTAILVLFVMISLPLVFGSGVLDRADEKVLHSLHKDSTLTGRTLMWAKADNWIREAPVLGAGYRSFWMSGSSDSLGILHFFKVPDARAFQLHNTIREIWVDTGLVGLTIFSANALFFLYYVIVLVFRHPSPSSAFLATSYVLTISQIPISTLMGIFYAPTTFFYTYGVASIVYFMNEAQESVSRQRAPSIVPSDSSVSLDGTAKA